MLRRLVILCIIICVQGKQNAVTRILGGRDAREGEFPYLASLRVYDYRNVLTHFCASSIISHWVVLTAAHCMVDYPKDRMEVVVGTNDFWKGDDKYKVDDYINHEQYNSTSLANDICLIKVVRQIQFGEKVGKINLPTMDPPGGLDMVIAGFGYIDNRFRRPTKLKTLITTSLSVEDCQERLKQYKNYNPITDKLLCTYKEVNKGICQGDSGGGLVYNGSVHGIASWNIPCAKGKPDVFTRVYKYLDWIDTTIAKLPISV